MRIKRVGLEDDADVSILRLDFIDHLTVEQKCATARKIDAGKHEKTRRLSAAGGAEECDKLAVLDREGEVGDHFDIAEAFDDIVELYPGHWLQPFTPPIDICIRYRCAAT